MRHDQSATPILIALLGMALLTAMDALIKGLTAHFATFQIVCFRFLASALILAALVGVQRPGWPRRDRLGAHAIRAALMVLTAATFYFAISRLPLAEVFVLTMTSPVIIALLGVLFIGERLRWVGAVAILFGFGGVVVIMADQIATPNFGEALALAAAMLSPVCYAASIVLLRTQTAHEPPLTIVFVQSIFIAAMSAPLAAAFDFHWPDLEMALRFLAVGLLGTAGHLCFAHALSRTTAARFSVVEYTGLVWAALFGYVFFAELPRPAVWAGAVLIVGACIIIMRAKEAKPA
jgi:S-adenosylmethionine uptake transporter